MFCCIKFKNICIAANNLLYPVFFREALATSANREPIKNVMPKKYFWSTFKLKYLKWTVAVFMAVIVQFYVYVYICRKWLSANRNVNDCLNN